MNEEKNIAINTKEPILLKRTFELKDHQKYAISRTSLVKKWKIIEDGISANMIINGVRLKPTKELEFLKGKEFDVTLIREAIRDIIPYNSRTTKLCGVEAAIFSTSLTAIEHYRYFSPKLLDNFVFTGDLCIYFEPFLDNSVELKNIPERISIEETYVISDAQLIQRLNRGETIEDIIKIDG